MLLHGLVQFSLLLFVVGLARGKTAEDAAEETQIAGTNDKCADFCVKTFSPHTNAQSDGVKVCEQGCRMYSVLQISIPAAAQQPAAADGDDGIKTECHKSCREAYGDRKLDNSDGVLKADACVQGCDNQKPFTGGQVEVVMDRNSPMFHNAESIIDGFFSKFSNFRDNAFDHFNNFFGDETSWGRGDGNPFAAMEKQMKQMESVMANAFNNHKLMIQTDQSSLNPLFTYGSSVGQNNADAAKPLEVRGIAPESNQKKTPIVEDPGKPIGNIDFNDGMPIIFVELNGRPVFEQGVVVDRFDSPNTVDSLFEGAHEPSPPIDPAIDPDSSWMSCLARRARRLSGATRWLLCVALMFSVFAMLWISLSIIRTAPRQRLLIPKGMKMFEKLNNNNDGGESGKLNNGLFAPKKDEAGPLPEKKFLVEQEEEMAAVAAAENLALNHGNTPPPPYTSNPSSPAIHRPVRDIAAAAAAADGCEPAGEAATAATIMNVSEEEDVRMLSEEDMENKPAASANPNDTIIIA